MVEGRFEGCEKTDKSGLKLRDLLEVGGGSW